MHVLTMTDGALLALKVEIKEQCFRIDLAYDHLDKLLSIRRINYYPDKPNGVGEAFIHYSTDVWSSVHTILSAAGIISRILWPRPPNPNPPRTPIDRRVQERDQAACARAKAIWTSWPLPRRESLKVLTDVSVRNAIEHVENGAADWMEKHAGEAVRASGLGVTGPSGIADPARQAFRYLFLDTRRVKVGKDTCDLKGIIAAARRIEQSLPIELHAEIKGIEFTPIRIGERPEGVHEEPTGKPG
jgi:hypothetical protein